MALLPRFIPRLALVAVFSLAACDATDPIGPDPDPDPDPTTVTFDWSGRIQIIEDCEVGGSNTGDFEFKVEVEATIDGRTSTDTILDRGFAANTGTSVGVSSSPTTFSVPDGTSASFEVLFYAIENDVTSADDLDITESIRHSFSNGRISPSGSQRINLSDGGNCEVELRYTASAS
ncbi:hypothetical protein [Rubricoccus marinus]|uniref:Uncharacterized protein n=1 Tax=Rubricoccus marinus TaxID=716817 RepID=A0A259U2J4_9BACT|nr:hypothetical protein [Rubricoccus marinus]OZC04219.1 hypothetical protein BSZ36_15250 [Rubricoccus marinus]